MTAKTPPAEPVTRAAGVAGAEVVEARGLRAGGAPRLPRFDSGRAAVLHTDARDRDTEVAALDPAERPGVPAGPPDRRRPGRPHRADHRPPRHRPHPREQTRERLTALDRTAAALHAITPEPTPPPLRRGPIGVADAGCVAVRDRRDVPPLPTEAVRHLAVLPHPADPPVFAHGDRRQGNTLRLDGSPQASSTGTAPESAQPGWTSTASAATSCARATSSTISRGSRPRRG